MHAGAQAELMRAWVRKRALSRSREQAGLPCRPMREARVPLQLSEAQVRTSALLCFCAHLAHLLCP